jgi:hypothetical protein
MASGRFRMHPVPIRITNARQDLHYCEGTGYPGYFSDPTRLELVLPHREHASCVVPMPVQAGMGSTTRTIREMQESLVGISEILNGCVR